MALHPQAAPDAHVPGARPGAGALRAAQLAQPATGVADAGTGRIHGSVLGARRLVVVRGLSRQRFRAADPGLRARGWHTYDLADVLRGHPWTDPGGAPHRLPPDHVRGLL